MGQSDTKTTRLQGKIPPLVRTLIIVAAVLLGIALLSSYPLYLAGKFAFNRYFERWGTKLVELENRGLLSTEFGAAWKDILDSKAMQSQAEALTARRNRNNQDSVRVVDGVFVDDYPSLSIIRLLNQVNTYSNTISIVDRKDRMIADIRTDHTRATIAELPPTLVTALIAAEDGNFRSNTLGFEFDSYVRAALRAIGESITSFRPRTPRGTSTITQQVAKLFISDVDREGRRYVSRSIDRKLREMRLAAAIRKLYTPDQILEVYANHCVTSDYGLIGYKDIARGLLRKQLSELSDAECIYLARMVKWGRNIRSKIVAQCHVDMPRMASALGWDEEKQFRVLREIESLEFHRPSHIQTDHGHLVDMANEFWLDILRRTGTSEPQLAEMNIIDPNSLIRKKGNVVIRLTIDLPLQKELERLVKARGYGPDTTIIADVRIGSHGEDLTRSSSPKDTLRHLSVLTSEQTFSEPESNYQTTLSSGDTLITNVRYKKLGKNSYRRSVFYYTRAPVHRPGQYFSYAIIDSKSGKLRAYYSRDRIGSRLVGLIGNPIPNGSSTAKPILNALNFDLGIFRPYAKWNDSIEVMKNVPWKRRFNQKRGRSIGVVYENTAVRGRGYPVSNHDDIFEGCQYVFDHLATSNNILGVETIYRLNTSLFDKKGSVLPEAVPVAGLLQRINAFGRIRNDLKLKHVTGVRLYKELTRLVGVDIDTMRAYGRRVPISDSMYSVALGTLEMTLLEQAHIFNALYNNDIIERPAEHPSLALELITIRGDTIAINDTIKRYHPFTDINSIRPTLLGLHKRLVSNRWDGLNDFDIPLSPWMPLPDSTDTVFTPDMFYLEHPVANFAKSGTTDDILRPFDADPAGNEKTNYGLWNAVVRIDLSRLDGARDSAQEVQDLTIACIGECNRKYTGPRDGKTLHKFVSIGLLKKAGTPSPNGFFSHYEKYLKSVTPDSERDCGAKKKEPDDQLLLIGNQE